MRRGLPVLGLKARTPTPPKTTFPVREIKSKIKSKVPASGAATPGPTISAEHMPRIKGPSVGPPRLRRIVRGIWNS